MKLSDRLQACADFVTQGNVVADVGTDHGFLPIYLLRSGISPRVLAADLREKPLETARKNALEAGVDGRLEFYLSNGLAEVPMNGVDTVICAGMGGDLIAEILEAISPDRRQQLQFILQPQSAVSDLRYYLGNHGFEIQKEAFAEDAGFIYTIMDVRWIGAGARQLRDGQCFVPQGDTVRSGPLYDRYMTRVRSNTEKTVIGLKKAQKAVPEKLSWYEAGLSAIVAQMDSED